MQKRTNQPKTVSRRAKKNFRRRRGLCCRIYIPKGGYCTALHRYRFAKIYSANRCSVYHLFPLFSLGFGFLRKSLHKGFFWHFFKGVKVKRVFGSVPLGSAILREQLLLVSKNGVVRCRSPFRRERFGVRLSTVVLCGCVWTDFFFRQVLFLMV
jgi:hypothetical protein